ncbi:MAG: endonuclease MutS2 [Lactobacillus sp.]|jgi:DNA mismatch repair protein MutS2|nr:endonuclease MutS2 [Lactobacillus sp.]MCH3905978.1 endonuclease MutS2 [Lactobacillus sp.]MCH3990448.1 endonuclease MutS2 [Lactobacillus sp.]MCH4068837.1 endonuclease MutS2 [Lactobacillus sp.]MCI1304462.1 endonuclease MutS2 [Lactobacillus sp.]
MKTKILNILEFPAILTQLADCAVTDPAKQMAMGLTPSPDQATVQQELDQTWALSNVLRVKGQLPITNFVSLQASLERLHVRAALNRSELGNMLLVLTMAKDVEAFTSNIDEVDLTAIAALLADLEVPADLLQALQHSIEYDGTILDHASAKLATVRDSLTKNAAEIKMQMNRYLQGSTSKYLSENILTIRDERYVLPVKQEFRAKFGGVVHDQSASGQTLYIEPAAVVDLNNRQQNLFAQEKQEISRILRHLSNLAGNYQSELARIQQALTSLDFISAKAKLAKKMRASEPKLSAKNEIILRQARHPLIDPEKVVPNDIRLGGEINTLLITGPNTGGKTITLKTVGLLQLMAQSGLFIPASEGSQVGVFDQIFADIGDEQSIAQSLSTFSSHIDNIIQIMQSVDQRSLVLIDELGAGTDPEEGARLAIAILDSLREQEPEIMVTTHYPELKLYGYNRPKTSNASMEFDLHTLAPTYRLQLGIPGQSNAFAIARRLGMKDEVVQQAEALMSDNDSDLNRMIERLNEQTRQATKKRAELADSLTASRKLVKQLRDGLDILQQREQKQLAYAQQRADQVVAKKRRQAEQIIAELEQQQGNVPENKLIEAKGKLNRLQEETYNLAHNKVLQRAKKRHQVAVGDLVKVLSYGQTGHVVGQLSAHEYEVQIGILKVKVNDRDLEKTTQNQQPEPTREVSATRGLSRTSAKSELDLRGERYEEAITDLDRYLDSALLAGLDTVTIIHGIGTGAVRQGVWKYLRSSKHVKSFNYAPANQGGNGATIVKLR